MKNRKIHLLLLLLLFLIPFFYISAFYQEENNSLTDNKNLTTPKKSGYWVISSIIIDDTNPSFYWNKTAEDNFWCTGNGTWEDPYIIENTTIDGGASGNCIEIRNSKKYFIIRNCTLYNSGGDSTHEYGGIYLYNVKDGELLNNFCSNSNYYGIYVYNCVNITIVANEANNNLKHGLVIENSHYNKICGNSANNNFHHGLMLYDSDYNQISGNNANNNNQQGTADYYYGIYLFWSDNNKLINNTANYNTYSGMQIATSNNNEILNNIASNNVEEHGIKVVNCQDSNLTGNIVNHNGRGGIYARNSYADSGNDNIRIWNNTAIGNHAGIYVYSSDSSIIRSHSIINNNLSYNKWGILFFAETNRIIKDNYIFNNTLNNNAFGGILAMGSRDNIILNNTINNNIGSGIWLSKCRDNVISENLIFNNGLQGDTYKGGILIYESFNTEIIGNEINNNKMNGIFIATNSYSNNITDNIIINQNTSSGNSYGINIRDIDCTGNLFYNNTLIGNSINARDDGTNNFWNTSKIGNYWSDYNGTDRNDDGIGDTPYIFENIIDYLPILNDGSIDFEFSKFFLNTTKPEYFHKWLQVKCSVNNITDLKWVYLCENSSGVYINRSMTALGNGNWTFNLNISELGWRECFSIYFYSNDSAGRININNNGTKLYRIEIFDFQKPTTNMSFIPHSGINIVSKFTQFSLLADDDSGSGVKEIRYKINNSNWIEYIDPFSLYNYSCNYYNVSYYSIDLADNIGDIKSSIINLINPYPPKIIFDFSLLFLDNINPEYFHSWINISCILNDTIDGQWVYLCDNSSGLLVNRSMTALGDGNWAILVDISTLNYGDLFTFSFYAGDTCGNIGFNDNLKALYKVKIYDFKKPSTNIFFIPPSDSNIVTKTTQFSLLADDDSGSGIAIIRFKINNSIWFEYDNSINFSNLALGYYNISFYSIDVAGNIGDINSIIIVLIDVSPPGGAIPGYDLFFLTGFICLISIIYIRKRNRFR